MERSVIEEKFLDYLEGALPESERIEIEKALESDDSLRRSLESYKKIVFLERSLAESSPTISPNFSVKVMNTIEERKLGFFRRLFMDFALTRKGAYTALATLATVVLVVKGVQNIPFERSEINVAVHPADIQVLSETKSNNPSSPKIGAVIAKEEPATSVSAGSEADLSMPRDNIAPQRVQNEKKGQDLVTDFKSELVKPKAEIASGAAPSKDQVPEFEARTTEVFKKIQERVDGMPSEAATRALAGKPGEQIYYDRDPVTSQIASSYGRSLSTSHNTEEYAAFVENERLSALKEPSSTFSIDVDTASYTNARRFLKDGMLPPKDSIRIEEFINYFDYNYPVQYEKPFTLSYEIAPSPLEKDRYLLKLGIKAKDIKDNRKPWNIVFLVDVSGSMMDHNKLPLVQRSLKIMLEKMGDKDSISIVTYAGNAGVVLEPTRINERQKIINAIDNLNAGGSTNGSGGITVAYQLAEKNRIVDGVNRVVLATDGDFNVGITSRDELIKFIEDKRKNGVTLTTLGFGTGNIKDATMELLANKGNGNYFYIDNFQEARKVLETDLMGTIEVVAKDVKLQIEFNPKNVSYYRLVGYENRKLNREDFNNDKIDAGEIGSGHTVTAIYEVVLGDSELSKRIEDDFRYQKKGEEVKILLNNDFNAELAFLKIRYKEPDGNESSLLQYPIESKDIKRSLDEASDDFKFASAVSYFAHLLRGSKYVGNYSYKDIRALAESSRGEDKKGYRQEFIEMVKNAESINR